MCVFWFEEIYIQHFSIVLKMNDTISNYFTKIDHLCTVLIAIGQENEFWIFLKKFSHKKIKGKPIINILFSFYGRMFIYLCYPTTLYGFSFDRFHTNRNVFATKSEILLWKKILDANMLLVIWMSLNTVYMKRKICRKYLKKINTGTYLGQ